LYRVFHHCLKPLEAQFGMEFYKDRIRASRSARPVAAPPLSNAASTSKSHTSGLTKEYVPEAKMESSPPSGLQWSTLAKHPTPQSLQWTALMLADSALPVGSFAHSAGLEAASQLGLLLPSGGNLLQEDLLSAFVQSSTQSIVQSAVPFVVQAHRIASEASGFTPPSEMKNVIIDWLTLDQNAHAVLVGNAPACRASLDQGRGLLRVLTQWKQSDDTGKSVPLLEQLASSIVLNSSAGHFSTVLGVVVAVLDLSEHDACNLLGFCVARDLVSAAVRLNLIGPLASVPLLGKAADFARQGTTNGIEFLTDAQWAGAGCSPLLEAIQPCHDVLSMRLFRT
jgi:urease accessory protein